MNSFNAFRFIIDLFSTVWNALRGRARPTQIAQQDVVVPADGSAAADARSTVPSDGPRRVVTASRAAHVREAAITATIYIDAKSTDEHDALENELDENDPDENGLDENDTDKNDPDENDTGENNTDEAEPVVAVPAAKAHIGEQSMTMEPESAESEITEADMDGPDLAAAKFVSTDAPVLEKNAATMDQTETPEVVDEDDDAVSVQPADDSTQIQAEDSDGHDIINKHEVEMSNDVASDEASAPAQESAPAEPDQEMPPEQFIDLNGEAVALTSLLESLLFVSDAALEPEQAAKVLPCTVAQIEAGLERLRMLYQQEGRGLRIQERGGHYLLVTMPAAASVIESFLNLDLDTRLSGPALEALAVIAYRQPVTRAQIEAVRGVDCGHVLRVLLQHELIEEAGRLETVGRPILYGVTDRFLQHFGLTSMTELPKLETTDADMLWAATQLAEETEEPDAAHVEKSPTSPAE
ncbi:MAG: SMC-Scp complex subunit ScpB [Caldilineaceae bacterium]|nr:SMC-Scp complex subunit ScpB [Caldilineaceae bacterium]